MSRRKAAKTLLRQLAVIGSPRGEPRHANHVKAAMNRKAAVLPALLAALILPFACASLAHAEVAPAVPPDWDLVNGDWPVSFDGVLLFRLQGNAAFGDPNPVFAPSLFDQQGTGVLGSFGAPDLETEARYATFRPEPPFTPAFSYSGSSFVGRSGFMFTAGQGLGAQPPDIEITARTTINLRLTKRACCAGVPFGASEGAVPSCLPLRYAQEPTVHITMREVVGGESASRQYLYKARLSTRTEAEPSPRWLAATDGPEGWSFPAPRNADEHCYRIDMHRLTDDESFSTDEECTPNTLGSLEEIGPSVSEILVALNLLNCTAAPPGFEDVWCAVNRNTCGRGDTGSIACEATHFDSLCPSAGALEVALTAQVERAAAAAGLLEPSDVIDSGTRDDAAMSDESDAGTREAKDKSSGCSAVGSAPSGASAWAVWLMLGALGALVRIRYAARAWRNPRTPRRPSARRATPIGPVSNAKRLRSRTSRG